MKFQLRNLRRAMNAQAEKDRRKAARGMRRQMTLNRSPTQSIHGSPPGGGLQKQSTKMCASPRPASSPLPPPLQSALRAFTPLLTFCSRALARAASSISTSISDESDIRWSNKVCRSLCGPMIDPNSRFRTSWNICLAFFIIYCGIAVPFEIAFEVDMVNAMCGVGEERLLREDCPSYLQWFWLNFLVDLWFISDIVINFRTGCARAPQSHPLPTRSPPARHPPPPAAAAASMPRPLFLPLAYKRSLRRAPASPTPRLRSLTPHFHASMCSAHPPPACAQICKKGAW